MEDKFLKILDQLPSAVAIIYTVTIFVKHMASESAAQREFFRALHEEHIDQRAQTRAAMEKMVAISEQNISATNRNTFSLETLAKAIDGLTGQRSKS